MGETPDDGGANETLADTRPVEERTGITALVAGRYELRKLIGEGGMGEVHDCRDTLIDRAVALKTIRRDRSRRQLEPRLVREGCVQAQLEHPSIVPVYEMGKDETGAPYFTMRKLTGTPLDEVIARRKNKDSQTTTGGGEMFSPHRLLTAFSQICLALEFAHSRGVLHRDLKPANIMLGEFGEVYVLDWGLAKLGAKEEGSPDEGVGTRSDRNITVAGTTLGTPGYMAPEQIGGNTQIDGRADVFALGAVLFEILTLEPLLDEAAIEARLRSRDATWDARPSARAHGEQVPPEFDRICARATAIDPARRYPSARALHDEIEAYLDGERDVGLRKKLAAAHLAKAEAARSTDRDEALREVNRALALVQPERRAVELFVELLDTPSASETARAEVEAAGIVRHRASQPFVLGFTTPWFAIYPFILLKRGTDNLALAIVPLVAWAAATFATFHAHRTKTTSRVWYPVFLFMLATGLSSICIGPLFLIPSIATAALAAHTLVQPRNLRRPTFVFGALAIVLPMVPVWLGLFKPYSFPNETTLVVHAVTRVMHGRNLGIFLTVMDFLLVVGVSAFAVRFRHEIDRARAEKGVTAWQLSKLLPPAMEGKDDEPPVSGSKSLVDLDSAPLEPIERAPLATTMKPKGDEDTLPPVLELEGARYVVAEEIAQGSTTSLVRVHDRLLGRDVAMKRPKGAPGGHADREIRREAIFQASVEHPFIPPIYEVGSDEAGAWFTTKLVRGKRLSNILRSEAAVSNRGRHERLTALAKVCLTIEFAHSRGVLHAALYPDNIVLGDFGEVYVLGWGNAKRHIEGTPPTPTTGPLGQLTSRPLAAVDYLAPEQASNDQGKGELDARTDVYALGALLFAVASGKPPSATDAQLPSALAKICKRAMAPDPKDRYRSARSLHDALEAFLSADRDEELRRQLAEGRLAKAERRAKRALEEDDEIARVAALRELGRALALAPERGAELRLLARLLKYPPRKLPIEVRKTLELEIWEVAKRSGVVAAILYTLAFVVALPLYSLVVGVREPAKLLAVMAAWAVAAVVVYGQTVVKSSALNKIPWAAFTTWIAVAMTSLIGGPWCLCGSLSITTTMVYALAVQPRWRYAMVAVGGVAAVIPALPVLFGISDVIELHTQVGRVTEPVFIVHGADLHPPAAYLVVLVVVNLLSVLAAGFYAAQYRDVLDSLEAENRAKVHALSRLM